MTDHSKFANAQVRELVTIGFNPLDAQAAVDAFLHDLPSWADPSTYVLPDVALVDMLTTREVVADARIAWYSDEDIPARYKRLLDAKATT